MPTVHDVILGGRRAKGTASIFSQKHEAKPTKKKKQYITSQPLPNFLSIVKLGLNGEMAQICRTCGLGLDNVSVYR